MILFRFFDITVASLTMLGILLICYAVGQREWSVIDKFLENEHPGITNYRKSSSASSKLEPTTFNISKGCREVNEQLTLLLSTPPLTMASRLATRALGA